METSPLICRANQWTGYYIIGASFMKELNVEANLESRIAKLTTEEDFPKNKKQT